ncbi:unnamed protein product, partial [Ectocarpus sp. 12 AP-2014]
VCLVGVCSWATRRSVCSPPLPPSSAAAVAIVPGALRCGVGSETVLTRRQPSSSAASIFSEPLGLSRNSRHTAADRGTGRWTGGSAHSSTAWAAAAATVGAEAAGTSISFTRELPSGNQSQQYQRVDGVPDLSNISSNSSSNSSSLAGARRGTAGCPRRQDREAAASAAVYRCRP